MPSPPAQDQPAVEPRYDSDDELQRETGTWQQYHAAHPYPSYEQMNEVMGRYVEDTSKPARGQVFAWMSEYGPNQHAWCKEIYDALYTVAMRERVRGVGQRIYDCGGHDAMVACCYVMANFGPQARDPEARRLYSGIVSAMWNGVGEWQS